jgi:integrase
LVCTCTYKCIAFHACIPLTDVSSGPNMKAVISVRLLASASANPGTRPFEITDRDLVGFILRVQPSGARSFLVQIARGRRITLGAVGHLTPAEARERAEKVLGNVAHGLKPLSGFDPDERMSLKDFVEQKYQPWLEANRPRTAAYTVNRIQRCFSRWFLHKLDEITPDLIEDWKIARFRKGRTASTVLRDIATLSAILTRAVRMGKLEDNPVRRVDKPKIDRRPQVRFLDPAEEARLRKALIDRDRLAHDKRESANDWRRERYKAEKPALPHFADHLTPAVLISMNTGLRRGELLGLRWTDINFPQEMLTVRSHSAKTGDTRHVPLNREATETLKRWRKQNVDSDRVFPVSTSFKTSFTSLLKAASITTPFRWHDLRHHFASRLVQAEVPLNTVRELLGHGSLSMTIRYAHLAPDQRKEAVDKLNTVVRTRDTSRRGRSRMPSSATPIN